MILTLVMFKKRLCCWAGFCEDLLRRSENGKLLLVSANGWIFLSDSRALSLDIKLSAAGGGGRGMRFGLFLTWRGER